MKTAPDISIVVCTRNRAARLTNALESLFRLQTQNLFSYEIVVVDNGSTDDTSKVCDDLARQFDGVLRRVYEPKTGIATARNRGYREAAGAWVAYFDDDQLAEKNWLAELWRMALDKGVRCVGGAVALLLPAAQKTRLDPFTRMLLGEADWSSQACRYSEKVTPGAGNLMIRRSLLEELGGFDEAFLNRSEDTDLFLRLHRAGNESWYVPTAKVWHVITPDRLEPAYLRRLAENMGSRIAELEFERLGPRRFALWRLAKVVRWMMAQVPLSILLGAVDAEKGRGYALRCALSRAHAKRGLELITATRAPNKPAPTSVNDTDQASGAYADRNEFGPARLEVSL